MDEHKPRSALLRPSQPDQHIAGAPPVGAPAHIDAARPVLIAILLLMLLIGLATIGAGIWLVALGSGGTTKITLFGNSFESQSVGVAGIFCGAVITILGIRRLLTAIKRLGRM